MSTIVLHVCPEAAVGGPLALVKNGDMIELDVPARSLKIEVSDEELAKRRAAWKAPEPPMRAATRDSTSNTCSRPTPAPTWTS